MATALFTEMLKDLQILHGTTTEVEATSVMSIAGTDQCSEQFHSLVFIK
jgi:hypothetical protein